MNRPANGSVVNGVNAAVAATDVSQRPITFLGTHDIEGWKIKTYRTTSLGADLMSAARRRAADALPARPDRVGAFGVGFLIVHQTAGSCFALVDWWVREDELHQRVFAASADRPASFEPLPTPVVGCVPALGVLGHERQAWLRHVLANPAGPDIEAYLADTFTAVN
jgi:hypothetical protein